MTQLGVDTLAPAEVERPGEVLPASVPPGRSPIRPSEALRYGSLFSEQAFGQAIDDNGGLCAAATIGEVSDDAWVFAIREPEEPCPVCAYPDRPGYLVVHLNDYHRWTRPQIADWLQSVGL